MCGRYAAARDTAALIETLDSLGIRVGTVDPATGEVTPSYNAAPTRLAHVLTADADSPSAEAVRVAALSWGLVPSWAKDRRGAGRMINARSESAADRSAFRGLLRTKRCLVPADGWFEWQRLGDESRPAKQPYLVHPVDTSLLMFAGLYTWWREPRPTGSDPAPWFGSFTILTTEATPELAWLHDRMPLSLASESWAEWLTADEPDDGAARHLLADVARRPPPPVLWHPVDRRVGSVANDDPTLVEAIELSD